MTVPFSAYIYGAFPIQLEYSGTSYLRKHGRSPIDFPNYKLKSFFDFASTLTTVSSVRADCIFFHELENINLNSLSQRKFFR